MTRLIKFLYHFSFAVGNLALILSVLDHCLFPTFVLCSRFHLLTFKHLSLHAVHPVGQGTLGYGVGVVGSVEKPAVRGN